jgi:hypothetical protein
MMSGSYHKKKQGGREIIASVKTLETLFLQARIREPENEVRAQVLFELLLCRHCVSVDLRYFTSFNIHKNLIKKKWGPLDRIWFREEASLLNSGWRQEWESPPDLILIHKPKPILATQIAIKCLLKSGNC